MFWIMSRIPGTWSDSATGILLKKSTSIEKSILLKYSAEEFCQHRKKKNQPVTVDNPASDCWRIIPVIVEELYQLLLIHHVSDCWIIGPVTVEQSSPWLLKNHASHCWIILPVTVKQSCQWLLINYASGCWIMVPVTV